MVSTKQNKTKKTKILCNITVYIWNKLYLQFMKPSKVDLKDMSKINLYLTTTKHNKPWTICIILGIYCIWCDIEYRLWQPDGAL